MGVGPRTNLYSICGDPLTQLIFVINFFFEIYFFFKMCGWDDIERKWTEKDFGGDPLMQSIEHSSLNTALVKDLAL